MLRVSPFLMLAALSLTMAAPTAVQAISPSEEQCLAEGGEFDKVQGEDTCITNVGNSENSQTATDAGQGNLTNEKKVTCEGPGGSGDSSAHCK